MGELLELELPSSYQSKLDVYDSNADWIKQISKDSEASKNTQTSEIDVSDSGENKLKLSDLLFEYLEIGKNFKNTEKYDLESGK